VSRNCECHGECGGEGGPEQQVGEPAGIPGNCQHEANKSDVREYAPVVGEVDVHAVGPDQLDAVRALFDGERATRHCWCMAFCGSGWQFAAGWYGGGNRRRFEALTVTSRSAMGVLASVGGEPVGWCACGPRSRYSAAIKGRSSLLAGRPREEDEDVWLVACIFVDSRHRGLGVAIPLLRAAVSLAQDEGASAIEAWPLAAGVRRLEYDHVGRERVFARLGFRCIQRPTAERAIMRLELIGEGSPRQ
jgi:GNAT superfamily N-acetyltransferase